MREVKLPFGLRDRELIHVSQIERGKLCLCVCPGCKAPLVAKKGDFLAHHFAHKAKSDCTYQPETALHEYAKRMIARQGNFTLPSLTVTVKHEEYDKLLIESDWLPRQDVAIRAAFVEREYEDVVPDVQLDSETGLIFVEVAVTHFVDAGKRSKLRRHGIPTVELDLSKVPVDAPLETIDAALLGDLSLRKWAYHPKEAVMRAQLQRKVRERLERYMAEQAQYHYENTYHPDEFSDEDDAEGAEDARDENGPRDEEDFDYWHLVGQAMGCFDDAGHTDIVLRQAPRQERKRLYGTLKNAEMVAYHCYLTGCHPERLPLLFTRIDGGGPPFECPSVIWRTGAFFRFVAKNQQRKSFTLGDVVDWCRERYSLFSFGSELPDELARASMTHAETEVADFLWELEYGGYIRPDSYVAVGRRYAPTGKELPK